MTIGIIIGVMAISATILFRDYIFKKQNNAFKTGLVNAAMSATKIVERIEKEMTEQGIDSKQAKKIIELSFIKESLEGIEKIEKQTNGLPEPVLMIKNELNKRLQELQ